MDHALSVFASVRGAVIGDLVLVCFGSRLRAFLCLCHGIPAVFAVRWPWRRPIHEWCSPVGAVVSRDVGIA